jgi:hypothetical protein
MFDLYRYSRSVSHNQKRLTVPVLLLFFFYLFYFISAIPDTIFGVGTYIYLGLIWVLCSLGIVTAMTSHC